VAIGLAIFRVATLTLHRQFDTDEFEHIQAAWLMSRGLVIYRDFFEHHPPLLYLVVGPLVRAGGELDRLVAARLAMVPFAIAIVALSGAIAHRLSGRLGGALAAALLSTVVVFQQKSIEVRPDVPATAFLLAAILCATAPRLTSARLTAAGLAWGIALLFTPKVLFGLPALAAVVWWPGPHVTRARAFGALAGGVFALLAAAAGYLWLHGALERAIHFNVLFNLAVPYAYRWLNLAGAFGVSITDNWAFWTAGGLGTAASLIRILRGRDVTERRQEAVVLLASAGLAVGLVSIQVPLRQYVMTLAAMLSIVAGVFGARMMRATASATSPGIMNAVGLIVVTGVLLQPARTLMAAEPPFEPQVDALRYVWNHVPNDGRVFDCWTGLGLFRQPAFFYQFLGPDIIGALNVLEPDRWGQALQSALATHAGVVVIRDPMLAQLPAGVLADIRANFRPDASGLLFVKNFTGASP
jgi:hypothetical protein